MIPVLGIVVFVPVWFSWVAPLTGPSSYMGSGGGRLDGRRPDLPRYLYRKHPRRISEVGLIHLDEQAADEVPV